MPAHLAHALHLFEERFSMWFGHPAIWMVSLHGEYAGIEHHSGPTGMGTGMLFVLEQHDLLYPAAGVCLIFRRCFTSVCARCVRPCARVCVCALPGYWWLIPQALRVRKVSIKSSHNTLLCVCVFVVGEGKRRGGRWLQFQVTVTLCFTN